MKTRYIAVPAFQLKDEIIPIWDTRVQFIEDDYFGNSFKIDRDNLLQITAVFDVKEKKLIGGIEIDIYPDKTQFGLDQPVYHESKGKYRSLVESTISNITYESYDLEVMDGNKIDQAWILNKIENIDPKAVYSIKTWKPTYHCADGFTTVWGHQLYSKA